MSIKMKAVSFTRFTITQTKVKGWWKQDEFMKAVKKKIHIVGYDTQEFNKKHHNVIMIETDTEAPVAEEVISSLFEKHTDGFIKWRNEKDAQDKANAIELNKKGKPKAIKGDDNLKEMFEVIDSRWKSGVKEFKKDDYSMAACYWSDAYDLYELAVAYSKNDWDTAKGMSFDTCVREMIPEGIYRWYRQDEY